MSAPYPELVSIQPGPRSSLPYPAIQGSPLPHFAPTGVNLATYTGSDTMQTASPIKSAPASHAQQQINYTAGSRGVVPSAGQAWMPFPSNLPNCPPGLEYLSQIDQVLVKQKVELFETITNIETSNRYKIKNTMGQDIYKVKETSDFCTRQCCGPIRCFELEMVDHSGREVIHCKRPLKCSTCCFPCCLQRMTVTSPITGETLGTIRQNWHPFVPCFSIYDDKSKSPVLTIEGPLFAISCCGDVDFTIKSANAQSIGKITKQWSGLAKETFTDADNFNVSFPLDLDVKSKATLLGAVFLLDFMFFERDGNGRNE